MAQPDRRIAVLIDGAFFLHRLPHVAGQDCLARASSIVSSIRRLTRNHVKMLTGATEDDERWHRHIYRSFYYDALPYDGKAHHPVDNRPLDFGRSEVALQRLELFAALRRHPKMALRLGKVVRESDWRISPRLTKKVLRARSLVASLARLGASSDTPQGGPINIQFSAEEATQLRELRDFWQNLEAGAVALELRQKGVDMRIGLDISTLTLKRQVDTIVLVAGDSDFVPAAKLARREGVTFILDPLWQSVNDDLYEHIDGLQSGLPRPVTPSAAPPTVP